MKTWNKKKGLVPPFPSPSPPLVRTSSNRQVKPLIIPSSPFPLSLPCPCRSLTWLSPTDHFFLFFFDELNDLGEEVMAIRHLCPSFPPPTVFGKATKHRLRTVTPIPAASSLFLFFFPRRVETRNFYAGSLPLSFPSPFCRRDVHHNENSFFFSSFLPRNQSIDGTDRSIPPSLPPHRRAALRPLDHSSATARERCPFPLPPSPPNVSSPQNRRPHLSFPLKSRAPHYICSAEFAPSLFLPFFFLCAQTLLIRVPFSLLPRQPGQPSSRRSRTMWPSFPLPPRKSIGCDLPFPPPSSR